MTKEPKAKWFEVEGVLNYNFKKIDDKIELIKYIHERENHQIEWVIGALGIIFLSSGIFSLGTIFSLFSFVCLTLMGILYLVMVHYQKKAIIKLYLEKDRK